MSDYSLRPFVAADDGLHIALERASNTFAMLDLPPAELDRMVSQQVQAQLTSYRSQFPTADWLVIETTAGAAGRLIVDHCDEQINIVDVALLPRYRGRGLGTQILRAIIDEGSAKQLAVTLHVQATNSGAVRLYERLGFLVERSQDFFWHATRLPPKSPSD